MDADAAFISSSNRDWIDRVTAEFVRDLPSSYAGGDLQRLLLAAGLEDVRLAPTVILNSVAFTSMLFAERVARIAVDQQAAAFWVVLKQAEREDRLCSGGTNFTAAGRTPA